MDFERYWSSNSCTPHIFDGSVLGKTGMHYACYWCKNTFPLETDCYQKSSIDVHRCESRGGEQVFIVNGVLFTGIGPWVQNEALKR